MSVLDDFLRIRLYRTQAAEFQWMADNASVASVQRRYRGIARHYSDLADREEQADKAKMAERLEQLRLKRRAPVAQAAPTGVHRSNVANDNRLIGLLRLMEIYQRVRNRRTGPHYSLPDRGAALADNAFESGDPQMIIEDATDKRDSRR
jgi:hypothetical protein